MTTENDALAEKEESVREQASARNSGFAADVLRLVSGAVSAQMLGLLILPVLTRIYQPDAFGTLAVFSSIVVTIGTVSCLRYERAIVLPKEDGDAATILMFSISCVLGVALVSAILLSLYGEQFVKLIRADMLLSYLWLIPIALLANGLFLALSMWCTRNHEFGRLSVERVLRSGVTRGTQLCFGLVEQWRAAGLIWGFVLGTVITTAHLGSHVRSHSQLPLVKFFRLREWRRLLWRYRKFPLIDTWATLLNTAAWQLPPILLIVFFSETVVGYFALTSRVFLAPMALVGTAIAQAFLPRMATAYTKEQDIASKVESVFQLLILLGMFPFFIAGVMGGELFSLVFGEKWFEAGWYLQILSLWGFFWFISSPLSSLFTILEKQELFLVINIFILVTRVLSLFIGGYYGNIELALWLFSISGAVVYGGLTIWLCRLSGIETRRIYSPLAGAFLLCLPFMLTMILIIRQTDTLFAQGLALGAVTIAYYITLIYRNQRIQELLLAQVKSARFRFK